ncbi:uncharacterized protein LOC127244889 isoform X2 [Andrographis paniculata]|uniref:uncharacterized protein LOC127244889 isoform X2 n=1 Tax=Andrographis paniculata TaxID=175694 RepID=UPI0021E7426C|nr:uncharacterized protein LOC127244889 isoform X2 [Andrographis paniculata]
MCGGILVWDLSHLSLSGCPHFLWCCLLCPHFILTFIFIFIFIINWDLHWSRLKMICFMPLLIKVSKDDVLLNRQKGGDCKSLLLRERIMYSEKNISATDEKISSLYDAWSNLLNNSSADEKIKLGKSDVPKAPHLKNCKASVTINCRLDTRLGNQSFPPWTIWKGSLDEVTVSATNEQLKNYRDHIISEGGYPPWVRGSDEENYPLTRKVQRDLWLHQHPDDCSDPTVKFLVADWERLPGFGIGAQLAGMCGLFAIAVNEKRVLITNYYNRADHNGCKGSSRSSWSCYFFPETSEECRRRAFELMGDKRAWETGVITFKENYTTKEIWTGGTPRVWGNPWSIIQPTTEINGRLVVHHRKMDRRWWRAQAIRYLMRFESEYTCNLMNIARHSAFGREAAEMVLVSSSSSSADEHNEDDKVLDVKRVVWSNHEPWIPRPLLSIHVRMGDKACEMKVVGFEQYMRLATKIRKQFPHLNHIWLSTEMQEVIDKSKSKSFKHWKFYYTNVTRQTGNITMATYEASLGRETSTNYPIVNFLMAAEADFFVGALGSTWCFLIDGMRNTGGKVMSAYLSVNKDRFW